MDTRTRIEVALNSIAADWGDLTYVPVPSGSTVGNGAGSELRLPGGTRRMDLIAHTKTLLVSWCLLVLEERKLPGTSIDPHDVVAMAQWLSRHAPWLAEHEAGPDAAQELHELAGAIRSLVAPSGVRRPQIGACPAIDCPGVVYARLTGDADVDANQDLVCDVDARHAWSRSHYGILARAMGQDAPERMSAADLAGYLSARFRRDITVRHLVQWSRHYPISLHADTEGKYDRVQVTDWYIAWRASRAGRAA